MTHTIWKEFLPNDEKEFEIELPANSKILCTQTKNNTAYIFFEFQIKGCTDMVKRKFINIINGDLIENLDKCKYIGSYVLDMKVYHLYEKP